MRALTLVALLLLACDGPPLPGAPDAGDGAVSDAAPLEPSSDFASGTRLRAEVRSTDDGVRIFRGWYDSELGLECAFQIAEDGRLRCIPTTLGVVTYSDESCTKPLDVSGVAVEWPPLFGVSSDACRPRAVFMGTGDVTSQQNEYVAGFGGSCTFTSSLTWEYPTASHLAPSIFVGADLVTHTIDDELAASILVADDGATHVVGARDLVRGVDCDLANAPDGTPVCAPARAEKVTCNASSGAAACAGAAPVAFALDVGCGVTGALATAGEACAEAPELVSLRVSNTYVPPALARNPLGDKRLRAMWTSRNGVAIRATSFYDTKLDLECTGAPRCVPLGVEYNPTYRFLDDQCAIPVIVDERLPCMPVRRWVTSGGFYYERDAPLPPNTPVYAATGYLNCAKQDSPGVAYMTKVVSMDAFASLTDSTE